MLLIGLAAASLRPTQAACRPSTGATPRSDRSSAADRSAADPSSADDPGPAAEPPQDRPAQVPASAGARMAVGPAGRPAMPRGAVGVPVRLAEPATLSLLNAGDRVDLVSVDPVGGAVAPIAEGALVLGVTTETDPATGGLLLALDPPAARRTVGAAERVRFAVLLRADR